MPAVQPRGPWFHRFLIWFFSIVLALLSYWTLSYLLDDIGEFSPPDFVAFHEAHKSPTDKQQAADLIAKVEELEAKMQRVRQQQSLLREGTDNYERTMRQMAELERLRLQKGEEPTAEQQAAVAQAEQQFLKNQTEYERKTGELTQLAEEIAQLQQELRPVQQRLQAGEQAGNVAYQAAFERWQWRVAATKIGMLLPLIALAAWSFRAYRQTLYAPLIYAFGIAVGGKTLVTVHEYFPAIYFRYLLIGTSLLFTVWLLIKLVWMIARPQANWLLKQYREAYEAFLCPVCDFPIRRGPLKYLSWTKRTIKRLPMPTLASHSEPETAYTCPMCATRIYEECGHCHGIRASLLPACSQCGEVKELVV